MALAGFAAFLPVIKERLHLSASEVGDSILFSPLGAVLALPFLGKLIARFSSRRVLGWAGTGLCIAMPFVISAPTPWTLRLLLICSGAFVASLDAAMNSEIVEVQKLYPTPIVSSAHGCWSLGGFVGGALVAATRKFDVSPTVHAVAASSVMLVALWIAESRMLPHADAVIDDSPAFALPRGPLILIGALMMLAMGSEGAGFDWIAVYLRQSLQTSQALAALGFGIFSGAMAASRLLGDLIVLKLGRKRTLQIGSVVASIGFLAGVSAPSPALAIAGFVVGGFSIANIVPILYQASGNVEGIPTGTGIAAVSTMGYGMFFLAPPMVGYIADRMSLSVALGAFGCGVIGVAIWGPLVFKKSAIPT